MGNSHLQSSPRRTSVSRQNKTTNSHTLLVPKHEPRNHRRHQNVPNVPALHQKNTKEPISNQHSPSEPREEVFIDLFGPMPNSKHVLVVLDNHSRFPAAKIVPSPSSKHWTASTPTSEHQKDIASTTDLHSIKKSFNNSRRPATSSTTSSTHTIRKPNLPRLP